MDKIKEIQESIRSWQSSQGEPCMCLGDCKECKFHACSGCLCGITRKVMCVAEGKHDIFMNASLFVKIKVCANCNQLSCYVKTEEKK